MIYFQLQITLQHKCFAGFVIATLKDDETII